MENVFHKVQCLWGRGREFLKPMRFARDREREREPEETDGISIGKPKPSPN